MQSAGYVDGPWRGCIVKSGERLASAERDPKSFDQDLEWFLVAGSSAMRERGTLQAVVSMLELGGATHGVPNTDLYNEQQLGWKNHVIGTVERYRWLEAAWCRLDPKDREVLALCYTAPRAQYRSDQGFGARDHSPTVEEIQRGAHEPFRGRHTPTHTGVDAQLGGLAALCFHLTENPARLAQACQNGSGRVIAKELKRAREATAAAHKAWRQAKIGAPRRDIERVVPAEVYDPLEATP